MSSTPIADADQTRPFDAHARFGEAEMQRLIGLRARGRDTRAIRSRGRDVLHEMMIWSLRSPLSIASAVDSTADSTMHSLMISSDVLPRLRSVFSCIFATTSSWLSEPPLTPMRTGLP